MALSKNDLDLLACMYDRGIIIAKHMPVEAIARFCRDWTPKMLKRQLKRLAGLGFVNRVKTKSFSLTKEGVIEAKRHLGITIANIDPGEDAVTIGVVEEFLEAIEEAGFKAEYPMEKAQILKRRGMEFRLMLEELLQVETETRSRRDVEIAVRKFVDRMDRKFTEQDIQELVDGMCKAFNIRA